MSYITPVKAVPVLDIRSPLPAEVEVFGLVMTFRPQSKLVRFRAPAAINAAVSFRPAHTPKLSLTCHRSPPTTALIAVVAAVVPRLEIRLFANRNPSWLLAFVAAPVNTVRKFRALEESLNSQFSMLKSWVPKRNVPEVTVWVMLTR